MLQRRLTTTAYSREMQWSGSEKSVGRRAFKDALKRELDDVIEEAKRRMESVTLPDELWDLQEFLTRRRNQIDAQFDFRYSVLPMVFATLLRQKKISASELEGLSEEKIEFVRCMAKTFDRLGEGW